MWTDLRVSASPMRSSVSEMPVSSRGASNRPERSKVPMYSLSGYSSATSALSGIGLVMIFSHVFLLFEANAGRRNGNDLDQSHKSRAMKEKHTRHIKERPRTRQLGSGGSCAFRRTLKFLQVVAEA